MLYHAVVKHEPTALSRSPCARRVIMAIGMLVVFTGCSTGGRVRSPFDGSRASASGLDPIEIEVQSLNFNDVTVWAVRQGNRIRLGQVTGKTNHIFRIDWNVAIPISFMIDVIGGRSCTTGRISVDRNSRVWISVPANVGNQPCRISRR